MKGAVIYLQNKLNQIAELYILESGLDEQILEKFRHGQLMCSTEPNGKLEPASEDQMKTVNKIEESGDQRVWHIISGLYQFPQGYKQITTYLIASTELFRLRWAGKTLLSRNCTVFAETETYNFGDAIVVKSGEGLHRVA